jgi:hypothetical protein
VGGRCGRLRDRARLRRERPAAGGSILHNRYYFSERQRLLRDLGENGWINGQDLRTYAGAAAKAQYLHPDLPVRQGGLGAVSAPPSTASTSAGWSAASAWCGASASTARTGAA